MVTIIASDEQKNSAVIAASTSAQIQFDLTKIKQLGAPLDQQHYNGCFIVNNHSGTIKITIGKDIQLISSGDAFEWGYFNQVKFNTALITEMGGLAQIDIDDVTLQAKRFK